MALVFGVAALVIDIGMVYYEQTELNASTQAAALAAAWAMSQPGATTATHHRRRYDVQRHIGQLERLHQSDRRFGVSRLPFVLVLCRP